MDIDPLIKVPCKRARSKVKKRVPLIQPRMLSLKGSRMVTMRFPRGLSKALGVWSLGSDILLISRLGGFVGFGFGSRLWGLRH